MVLDSIHVPTGTISRISIGFESFGAELAGRGVLRRSWKAPAPSMDRSPAVTLLGLALNLSHVSPIQGSFLERNGQRSLRRSNHGSRDADDNEQDHHRRPLNSPSHNG